ncbi:MAG: Rho termination factor N-terminal domain-containing protein, partial [Cyclobacteriaceae bacterium]|nr:Rho termination factor N-terminal domain-containing protein [Cyclobacteriaceae bacterium]
MYTIQDLNVQLLSELKELADKLGLENYKKLPKKELIYKILDFQASNPVEEKSKEKAPEKKSKKTIAPKPAKDPILKEEKKKKLPFKRENVKKVEEKPVEKAPEDSTEDMSAEDLLQSITADFNPSQISFDKNSTKPKKEEETRKESVKENRFEHKKPKRPNIKEFDGAIENEGVLEIMQDGYGFLRSSDYNYLA